MGNCSRRKFLRYGSTVVGSGVFGTAGCLGRATNEFGTNDDVDVPSPATPSYRRWLPEPSAVGPAGHEHYRSQSVSLAELRKSPDRKLSAFHRQRVEDRVGFLGVDDTVEQVVHLSGVGAMEAHVLMGRFDAGAVLQTVRDEGFSDVGTHREYEVVRRDGPTRAIAVADSAIVYGKQDDAIELVEAIVDTERGERPRYHQVSAPFASLTDAVGDAPVTAAETSDPAPRSNPEILQFEGSVGHATGRWLDDEVQYVRHVIRFEEEADSRVDTVRETLTGDGSFSAVEVRAEGKTVFVEGELEPDTSEATSSN